MRAEAFWLQHGLAAGQAELPLTGKHSVVRTAVLPPALVCGPSTTGLPIVSFMSATAVFATPMAAHALQACTYTHRQTGVG